MRIPTATYRIQFNLNFRFADAEALVPYLHDLGISDLYASPRFKARKGSSHGYDVADPLRINSELGTEEEFDRLANRLRQYGMGLLLDIVPNHMATSSENPWWMDVLEYGRGSRYAAFFDIDWEPEGVKISRLEKCRVILPILSGPYAEVLWNQGIRLRFDDRGFFFQYEDNRLPVNPKTYHLILQHCANRLKAAGGSDAADLEDLYSLSETLFTVDQEDKDVSSTDRAQLVAELKSKLWTLSQNNDAIRRSLDETLRTFNGVPGELSSFVLLDSLLSSQAYRLAHWRLAPSEVNYRRFFDINDLIGLRTEDPLVFSARHAAIMRLIQEGKVSGLRVDHIDGLFDPLEYLERLKAIPVPSAEPGPNGLSIYTVVEKITSGDEILPPKWPALGTTGYDFLNALNALFIDPQGYAILDESYHRFTGFGEESFTDIWYRSKKEVIQELFAADLNLLSHRLGCVAALDEQGRDVSISELVHGLTEVTACLPVYRTYYRDTSVSEPDRIALEKALSDVRRRVSLTIIGNAAFGFLRKVFLADLSFDPEEVREAWTSFITRWQQFTGAVIAKGLEDTALFVHHALISVNEVGNNPFHDQLRFGSSAFHDFNRAVLRNRPHTMNATSTHDTKWSEDVRARINVLSEMPHVWAKCLRRWSRLNKRKKTLLDGYLVPAPNEEVIFYQAVLGIWPCEPFEKVDKHTLRSRLEEFVVKAAREAKTNTSWLSPNEAHESALRHFVSSVVSAPLTDPFISDFLHVHRDVAFFGACNSCSQLLLKMTSPGVPDFYQGSEMWNLSLTDPDNRQPVDFRTRLAALEALRFQGTDLPSSCIAELTRDWPNGRLKLYLTARVLNFRRVQPSIFSEGCYLPLSVRGRHAKSVFAFGRCFGDHAVIVAVTRLLKNLTRSGTFALGEIWEGTSLKLPDTLPKVWTNIFTNERIEPSSDSEGGAFSVAELFRHFPFVVLTNAESGAQKP